jgi:hypothetical protein
MSNSEKNSLQAWAANEKDIAENNFYRILIESAVRPSDQTNSFSTWLLGAAGATFAIIIANLNKLHNYIQISSLKRLLLILTCSIVCGLAQKYMAHLVQQYALIMPEGNKRIRELIIDYSKKQEKIQESAEVMETTVDASLDFKKPINRFLNVIPRWIRPIAKKQFDQGLKDELLGYDKAIKTYFRQNIWLSLQLLWILVFIGGVIYSIA